MRQQVPELETRVQQFDNILAERKQSKESLSESQLRIASIVDIANEAIISIDEAGSIIICLLRTKHLEIDSVRDGDQAF